MPKEIKTIVLYPDLRLEFYNSVCTINLKYNELNIPEWERENFNIERYIPSEISSIKDVYALLELLNSYSGKQTVEYKKGRKSGYFMMLLLGFPALIILPPLGLFLVIYGVLGFFGLIKKQITLPKIKISSNYSSSEDVETLQNLIDFFVEGNTVSQELSFEKIFDEVSNKDSEDKNKIYENLDFDDGSKLLLFAYSVTPHYIEHWKHETKDGKPDYRYKDNPSYTEISHYSIALMVPGRIYYRDYVVTFEYNDFIEKAKKLESNVKIEKVKLGTWYR